MSFSNIFSLLQVIIVLGIVIFLANISIKLLNTHMTKQNRVIKIVERVSINNNSALALVEICGKYYLMSFTNKENKILRELDGENIEEIIHQKYFGVRKEVD